MGDHHKAAFEKAKRDVALFAVLKPVVLKRETRPGEHAVRIVEAEAVLREVISVFPLIPFVHGLALSTTPSCSPQT